MIKASSEYFPYKIKESTLCVLSFKYKEVTKGISFLKTVQLPGIIYPVIPVVEGVRSLRDKPFQNLDCNGDRNPKSQRNCDILCFQSGESVFQFLEAHA